MPSPDYTRLSAQLPVVYQEDAVSFAQIDAYLGLADELSHAVVEHLADLLLSLGPDATLRWPTDVPLDAGADALLASYLASYDDVAAWASFVFPASWTRDERGLSRRREFLARCARLWRRRGTPRGFLSWFSLYFGLPPSGAPYLLEHFKAPGAALTGLPYTATLFIPGNHGFDGWARREEAVDFVRRYAPAHVSIRVCFIDPGLFGDLAVLASPPVLPDEPTVANLDAYATAIEKQQKELNALLCSVVSVVSHESGIHIHECIDAGRGIDRLGVGLLPTDSTT
ncbi:hypothetical protein NIBR502772_11100 [Pseudarthrobacter sp. NIBRBAC000502772]|uniref:hypothetical protein n=1 Tax=Pseudarthrobacter sp. NIBRBAC000502772 TaxID=2590775 RepID=UPI00113294E0|nr:hypothetical protein [Pseudarthrobacter sp. NIBRBAC000502772]QDG66678.1 hypothetical protein NIBR502772_11100 [Pseudarthrobacter sp. NIBRBAC000502772]